MKHWWYRHYTSTACQHADVMGHLRCRLTCKFCNAPCRCRCHKETR